MGLKANETDLDEALYYIKLDNDIRMMKIEGMNG